MFNPLALFSEQLLQGFVRGGRRYFVRQSFPRGRHLYESIQNTPLLLCQYEDAVTAQNHYEAIAHDPHRFLYDWENEEHRERLHKAASQPEGFKVFANVFVDNWESFVTEQLRARIRAYVRELGWKLKKGEGVTPRFFPHYGEVYVSLQHKGRLIKLRLEDIEES
jgi:hypothetical protein